MPIIHTLHWEGENFRRRWICKKLASKSGVPVRQPASHENYTQPFLKRVVYIGREAAFKSSGDVDIAWKKYFPDGPDWRNVWYEKELPGYLTSMVAVSNKGCNRQLVGIVKELTAKKGNSFPAVWIWSGLLCSPCFLLSEYTISFYWLPSGQPLILQL